MKILVIAATDMEFAPFSKKISEGNFKFSNTVDLKLACTGVGQMRTAYNLQQVLFEFNANLVIQVGIAGAFTNELILGETVLVKQDCFGDLGMEENEIFTTIFDAGFDSKNEFPFEDGWLKNKNVYLHQSHLSLVKATTINKVSDSIIQKNQLINNFNADIESMEGAALHFVCLQESINFLQLRSISNFVGDRNKANWKIDFAIENLNIELEKIITDFSNYKMF